MTELMIDDIIKVSKDGQTTMGRVTDATDEFVSIFRDSGDVWYKFSDYDIEVIGSLTS